jgi:hypothetical protein
MFFFFFFLIFNSKGAIKIGTSLDNLNHEVGVGYIYLLSHCVWVPQPYKTPTYTLLERLCIYAIKAGFEIWIAQARPNFGCLLIIKY